MFTARIFTLYPDMFPGPLNEGLFRKAMEKNIWNLEKVDIRKYATDKHTTVDDTPYGGGTGMLMKPDVVASAIDKNVKKGEKVIFLTPRGKFLIKILLKNFRWRKQ